MPTTVENIEILKSVNETEYLNGLSYSSISLAAFSDYSIVQWSELFRKHDVADSPASSTAPFGDSRADERSFWVELGDRKIRASIREASRVNFIRKDD